MDDEKRDFSEVMAFLARKTVQVVNKVFRSKKLEEVEGNLELKEAEKEAQRLEKKSQKIQKKIAKKETLKMAKEKNILLKEKNRLLAEKLEDLKKDIQDLSTGKVTKEELQGKYPKKDKDVLKETDNIKEFESTKDKENLEMEKTKEITINKKLIIEENSKEFFTRIPYQKDKFLMLPKDVSRWLDDKKITLHSLIKSNDLIKVYNKDKEEIGVIKGEKIHEYYDKVKRKQMDKDNKDLLQEKENKVLKEITLDDINKELGINSKNTKEKQVDDSEVDIEKSLSYFGDTKAITFMDLANMENVDGVKEYDNFKSLQKQGLVKMEKGKDLGSSKVNLTKKGEKVLSEIKSMKAKGQVPSKSVVANIVKMVGKVMEQRER